MYESEVSQRLGMPGVAVGLAWTPMGGEIMFVEASRMDGEGKLTLTGQLGDVMKESAELALNWVRSHANQVRTGSGHMQIRWEVGQVVGKIRSYTNKAIQ